MPQTTEPVLDIDRVLFLDARNRKFVAKTARKNARLQDAQESLWQIALIMILIAGVLFVAVSTSTLNSKLARNGRVTTGVVVKKATFKSSCSVTYRFSGPGVYENQARVSYDACRTLAEGQKVDVIYDPQQPLYSNLKIASPGYPVWLVALLLITLLVAIYFQFLKVRQERHLCFDGQVVCGSLLSKQMDSVNLVIQYRFQAPAGFTIQSEGKGLRRKSNWTDDWQFFPDKPNQVAVLFVSESEFVLL